MFEQELDNIQKLAVNHTIGSQSSIALKSILESNIPANIKSFFRGQVEWLLFKEKQTERQSSKFNHSQEDVVLLQEQMDILLVYHYTFAREEFLKVLDSAAHFLFNYLCRPQWTLESYLFEEKSALTIKELSQKFRFCADYPYYWSILEKYLTGKNRTEIDKDEAMRLLRRIDAEIIISNSPDDLAKMTLPFFDFVGYVHQNALSGGRGDLPVKALIYFFEDKRITSVAQHLQQLRDKGKQQMLYDELVEAVRTSYTPRSNAASEQIPAPNRETAHTVLPSVKTDRTLSIPERERSSIIRTLFGGDEMRFTLTIEKILSAVTWEDAGLSLDHYFTMNDVDPFSRDAIILTNALQTIFTNRESS